ncbi:hypothetical protein M3O96_04930 [Aquiflexum sp. TKW24L]|uniref:hypothetical protein n=1 Tax=Aquiflexum sp. TKW24L TaxID=2942212 RepID=UPI0020C17814|nr:hypothetical protein [Aquiflexum sp. TKW24L]MCL6258420.1 hypothetical protein [Aquiflexum sp. TKW24L]
MSLSRTGVFLIFVLLFFSCASIQDSNINLRLDKSNCFQEYFYEYAEDQIPAPLHTLTIPESLQNNFSKSSINIANAMGILDLLERYLVGLEDFYADPSFEKRLSHLELYQKLSHRIGFAELEISSESAELGCEEERIEQIANYLKAKEDDIDTKLTVASIVVGAVGAILTTAYFDQGKTGEYIALGTGILGATLGVMILVNKKKVTFQHPRNHLQEIWEGPQTASYFPASVWYYLNYVYPEEEKQLSIREEIIEKWIGLGLFDNVKPKDKEALIEKFFGGGGVYLSDELAERASMYDQLGSQINLMMQDLKSLTRELEVLQVKKFSELRKK